MKLFKSLSIVVVALAPFVLEAAAPAAKTLTPEEQAERDARRARFIERTGGLIERPGTGKVVIGNAQTVIDEQTLKDDAALITREFRIAHEVTAVPDFAFTTADAEVTRTKASMLLFVVCKPELPMSLLASESRWALVNVAPLRKDAPSAEVLQARFKKMFMRTASALCGAGASNYKLSVMQSVTNLKELDELSGLGLDPQSLMAVMQRLQRMGVKPPKPVPYSKACAEGWAPAPTNDVQKAVWERIHSEKERGPANAIKIAPPKK